MRLARVPPGTRPVSDRAREGLFSSLGPEVQGAAVLDLFAGTGALGIEALSRGASRATFVDSAPRAVSAIRENLRRTRLPGPAEVRRGDAERFLRRTEDRFDLALLDPPYALAGPELDAILAEIAGQGVVRPGGAVVLTRPKASYIPVIPVHWTLERRLSYGDTVVLLFRVPQQQ